MQKRLISTIFVLALFGNGCISITTTPRETAEAPALVVEQPVVNVPEITNALTVNGQLAASSTRIASVSLSAPGFISIHSDVNGQLGPIIGQSNLIQSGTTTDLDVAVPSVAGSFYWAILHTDDGDGTFDGAKDAPTKDGDGNAVVQRFEAASSTQTSS